MKKIPALGLILILFSVAASAQRGPNNRLRRYRTSQDFNSGQITGPEKFQLKKDAIRLNMIQWNVRRDGVITPHEKRRVHKAKCKNRRDTFRFRLNGRNRVI